MEKEQFLKDSDNFKRLVANSEYGDALSIALNRATEAFKAGKHSSVNTYISVARVILMSAESEFGSNNFRQNSNTEKHCDFCGQNTEQDLLRGAEAGICRE